MKEARVYFRWNCHSQWVEILGTEYEVFEFIKKLVHNTTAERFQLKVKRT